MRHPSPQPHRRRSRNAAFTLIELLVVIGILVVLAAILIPTIAHVRTSVHQAATATRVQALMNAIENYYHTFNAYPGPLADSELIVDAGTPVLALNNTNTGNLPGGVTGTENLTLALSGGLRMLATANPPQLNYDYSKVGSGAVSLNPVKPSQLYGPYIEGKVAPLQAQSSTSQWVKWSDPALATDAPANAKLYADTIIPEYVDAYPDAMPILYIRAKLGASGSITNAGNTVLSANAAYDPRQLQQYVFPAIDRGQNATITIFNNTFTPPVGTDPQVLADFYQLSATPPTSPANYFGQYLSPTVPRHKGYLLITAGPDRKYMTKDDTINNGSAVK